MAILNNSNAISSGGYDINNSLRFRSSASAYLNRTPASAGNRRTWTWSAWVKRGTLNTGAQALFGSTNNNRILFGQADSNDDFGISDGNTSTMDVVTTQVFRDPSAWYHLVVAFDTTQATAANRVKIYVNGNQVTALSRTTYPTQNAEFNINNATEQNIGRWQGGGQYFDGYMAEINFIDGQALTPSSFGSTNATTGVWQPAQYTGTYGTNGFYLKFSDIALTSGSNAGLGKDFSGNGNYWNTNNISVTTGTTYDAMSDVPTLTSATVANYCVLNPLDKNSAVTVSNANLTSTAGTLNVGGRATMMLSTGKWYYEVNVVSTTLNQSMVGFANASWGLDYLGSNSQGFGWAADGAKYGETGTVVSGSLVSYTTGDTLALAVDMDAKQLTAYKNGSSIYVWNFTGTDWFPGYSHQNSTTFAFNFGQRPFSYTPPTGFVRLNAYNLPDSTIKKGNNSFGVLTYTGNGSTSVTRSDTSLVNFTPDFVWIKSRSSTNYHNLYDVNRIVSGDHKRLYSNDTAAEESSTYLGATNLNSFVSGGFTTGAGGDTNTNAATYVAWCWDANGSPVSNTSGSITSTVSVNTTAGFSVVTYTVPSGGASFTVGHGLGVAPKMIITKNRGGTSPWPTWVTGFSKDQYLNLNTTAATASQTDYWGSAVPTSTVFGNKEGVTWNSGATIVAYCWAEIAGFSKFGSYTGNGSADGTFVYTGFRPKYVLIKANAVYQWLVWDSVRTTYNIKGKYFLVDLSNAEDTFDAIDFVSNGFKIRVNHPAVNTSGTTYIYMAFAENPFKNANAA